MQESPLTASEGAVGAQYNSERILERVKASGEARNITGNLTWTSPLEATEGLDMALVDKFVQGHFRDGSGQFVVPAVCLAGPVKEF